MVNKKANINRSICLLNINLNVQVILLFRNTFRLQTENNLLIIPEKKNTRLCDRSRSDLDCDIFLNAYATGQAGGISSYPGRRQETSK